MAGHSLAWIITRNSASVNFIFNKIFSKNLLLFVYILDKSLEGSSAILHTQLVRIAFLDSRNYFLIFNLFDFFSYILVKSLEGSSAISHTISKNCLPDF